MSSQVPVSAQASLDVDRGPGPIDPPGWMGEEESEMALTCQPLTLVKSLKLSGSQFLLCLEKGWHYTPLHTRVLRLIVNNKNNLKIY